MQETPGIEMASRVSLQTLLLILKYFVTLDEKYLEYEEFSEITFNIILLKLNYHISMASPF